MEENRWILKDTISIRAAAVKIGVKTKIIQYYVDQGKIESRNGRILKADCESIIEQKSRYIGLKAFIMTHDSELFKAKYSRNRNKYIDYLEINDYFGVKKYRPEQMMFSYPEAEDFFFSSDDIEYLNFKSIEFFENYGLTEEEKVERLIRNSIGHPKAVKYLKEYANSLDEKGNIYTPSYTEFVHTVLSVKDVTTITDEDIISIIDNTEFQRTKELLVAFYKWVARYENVKYHNIDLKKRELVPIEAYSYEEFVALAHILFNEDYNKEHNLTIKALENHIYAEMWLFLTLHYVCGWRASDICKNWVYLDLVDENNPFNISPGTIKEKVLTDSISEKTYSDIALYSIKKLEMSFNIPSKTHNEAAGKLRAMITPDLRVFYGRLILIAEHHHYTNQEGYMKSCRTSVYQNWTVLRDFFGEEIYELTGRSNISSRRLNKSYLQGIEKTAREVGNTSLVAHIVASYARNHMDINTTAIYLRDHGLTAETANVVLYMMIQRGVMGVYLYQMLISAFPEQFNKLSMKEQTEIMERIPLSAYELETTGTGQISGERIYSGFINGEMEEPTEILKAMYSIGHGKGKAKDVGIYCKKRALGMSCVNPGYKSCIANLCPFHVFTSDGIPALIRVIKEYSSKEDLTGRNKYQTVLKQRIIPAFQNIINEIIKEMSNQEKNALKKLISEGLNE